MWCFSEWLAYKLAVFLILHLFHIRWFCFHNNSHLIQENVKLSFGQMLKGSIYLFGCAHAWGGGVCCLQVTLNAEDPEIAEKDPAWNHFQYLNSGPLLGLPGLWVWHLGNTGERECTPRESPSHGTSEQRQLSWCKVGLRSDLDIYVCADLFWARVSWNTPGTDDRWTRERLSYNRWFRVDNLVFCGCHSSNSWRTPPTIQPDKNIWGAFCHFWCQRVRRHLPSVTGRH